jgi:hypothetical protein
MIILVTYSGNKRYSKLINPSNLYTENGCDQAGLNFKLKTKKNYHGK